MDIYFQLMLFYIFTPQILTKNFAPDSCPIFVGFGQISLPVPFRWAFSKNRIGPISDWVQPSYATKLKSPIKLLGVRGNTH